MDYFHPIFSSSTKMSDEIGPVMFLCIPVVIDNCYCHGKRKKSENYITRKKIFK